MKVPVKVQGSSSTEMIVEEALPLQLPHKVLAYLMTECKLDSKISRQCLIDYWNHLDSVGHSFANSTKAFRQIHGNDRVCPVGLYGDEAVIGLIHAPQAKLYGFFLSVVPFRPTSTRLSRFLLWSIHSNKIVSTEETLYPLLAAVVASLNKATEEGVNNMYFVTSELRGDQVYLRSLFRYQASWVSTSVCYRCKATSHPTDMCYTHYPDQSADGSGWEGTLRSTESFILEELQLPLCHWTHVSVLNVSHCFLNYALHSGFCFCLL